MKYWNKICVFHLPLFSSLLLLQQSTVHASTEQQLQGRKHSTAHYFPNGTIYILGGIEYDPTGGTPTQFAPPILTLYLDKEDFSLYSTTANISTSGPISLPPITGHTSHLHVPSNSLFSVFGKPQNKDSPPLICSPPSTSAVQQEKISSSITNNNSTPTSRYQHTSVLINNNDLYVVGGRSIVDNTDQLISPQDMIWKFSYDKNTWTRLLPPATSATSSSMAGHNTIVYDNRWLISCCGQQEDLLISNSCTWFDTLSLNSTKITASNNSTKEWPSARRYASMISLPNKSNEYILFGGESEKEDIFDDIWKVHVDSALTMTWQKINYKNIENINYKRSGHASALIDDTNVVLYYGGQNGNHSLATDPIYLDLSKMEWINIKNSNYGMAITKNGAELTGAGNSGNNRLSDGAIAGIIVSILGVIALGIGLFVWRKRQQRQQHIHQQSRAARFSRSPSPMHSIALRQQRDEEKLQQEANNINGNGVQEVQGGDTRTGLAGSNFLSLPELALSRHSNNRISAISLGDEFRFSTEDYRRQSHQTTNTNNSIIIPKIELVNPTTVNSKKRESTGFKRLTLNLFSGSSQQQDEYGPSSRKKDRSSSLFQLRASRLLQPSTPNTPNTPDGRYPLSPKGNGLQSRMSLGAKSVSSVQWIGFNDSMDYKGSNWRDSSASSMHLAVVNAHKSSSHTSLYYTSDSAQSTPRSPRFPSHLRDSAAHYQLSDNEANSYNVEVRKGSAASEK